MHLDAIPLMNGNMLWSFLIYWNKSMIQDTEAHSILEVFRLTQLYHLPIIMYFHKP